LGLCLVVWGEVQVIERVAAISPPTGASDGQRGAQRAEHEDAGAEFERDEQR
jgi:hypothetical protein